MKRQQKCIQQFVNICTVEWNRYRWTNTQRYVYIYGTYTIANNKKKEDKCQLELEMYGSFAICWPKQKCFTIHLEHKNINQTELYHKATNENK